ncbi:DUF3880 domain-containing protein [Lachnospiraceae bacterium ZAX-1]
MKLLFYRYGSICEPDILFAFKELGLAISEITIEIFDKQISLQDSIKIVSHTLLDKPAEFIFSINFFPFLAEVSHIFKIPYLCWIVDSPVMELYATSITNPFNRIFIFDHVLYEEIKPFNPECIFYLPLATNIKQKDSVISCSTATQKKRFSSNLSFVGSLYSEKCAYDKLTNPPAYLKGYLEGLMEVQLKIYGGFIIEELLTDDIISEFKQHLPGFYTYPYDSFLTDKITMAQLYIGNKISALERIRTMELLSKQFPVDIYTGSNTTTLPHLNNRGLAKTLTEMPLIFHFSKINLNITSKSIRSGLPLRIWDILGCGGFVLTNFQSELSELLTPNLDLVCYESFPELVDKTYYYLSHEKEREEIAYNGYVNIKEHHTYPIRLEQMLAMAYHLKE